VDVLAVMKAWGERERLAQFRREMGGLRRGGKRGLRTVTTERARKDATSRPVPSALKGETKKENAKPDFRKSDIYWKLVLLLREGVFLARCTLQRVWATFFNQRKGVRLREKGSNHSQSIVEGEE